jgi:hypothetical protein
MDYHESKNNTTEVRMFADQLVDDGPFKISLKDGGGQAAINHIIGQRTAGGIRPAAHAERPVFALVVQFFPKQLFETAQIPQVPEDSQNRLLSFNPGHSSPRLFYFQRLKFRHADVKKHLVFSVKNLFQEQKWRTSTCRNEVSRTVQGGASGAQLFRLVLVVKRETLCLTFLLLHFGQETLVVSCSEMLKINENFLLQSRHSYSYVGISFLLSPAMR